MSKFSRFVKGVPSSFVFKNMKLETDKGAGEAKLFVGPKSQIDEIEKFYKFDEDYQFRFDKDNLLEYMHEVKMEYVFQKMNKYKDASIETWNELCATIQSMQPSEMNINISKYMDASRVYVRADEEIFSKIFRKITVPKLTDVPLKDGYDRKKKLIELIEKPLWTVTGKTAKDTLIPDLISICKVNNQYQFIIFDAKYYNAQLEKGIAPTGQPGIESVTKQED